MRLWQAVGERLTRAARSTTEMRPSRCSSRRMRISVSSNAFIVKNTPYLNKRALLYTITAYCSGTFAEIAAASAISLVGQADRSARMSTKPGLKVVKAANHNVGAGVDWTKVARALFISRALDELEEK